MIKVIELFSGIGSQTQALKNIGVEHEVVAVCEIDKYAHKSYEAIHGETLNLGDITKVESLPDCDLLTYSFPCTDLSLAGKQAGMSRGSGTRSGLLWEVERLLRSSKLPKYLLMENVKPLVGEKFIDQFNEWQSFLWKLGYRNFWSVLNAKDYGIPQNRERVFMVSILGECDGYAFPVKKRIDNMLANFIVSNVDDKFVLNNETITKIKNWKSNENPFDSLITDNTEVCSCLTSRGAGLMHSGMIMVKKNNTTRVITPLECWRLMGFADEQFEKAQAVNSNTQLYKQAGNSIVVNVLEGIFRNLLQSPENGTAIQMNLF